MGARVCVCVCTYVRAFVMIPDFGSQRVGSAFRVHSMNPLTQPALCQQSKLVEVLKGCGGGGFPGRLWALVIPVKEILNATVYWSDGC